MGILKDLLLGGAALKALKRSDRPTVFAPPSFTVVGMRHKGFGSSWEITYIHNDRPNSKMNFTVNRKTKVRTSGKDKWQFNWG